MSVSAASAETIPFYTLKRIDLGLPGGSVNAKGINAAGQVTGTIAVPPSGITQAFFYDGTTTVALGALGGQSSSVGVALNGSGQVVGRSETEGVKAFAWTPPAGPMVGISPAPTSLAQALNDSGLVVGLDNDSGSLGGFAWQGGTYTSHAATFARFDAVNAWGTIAGSRIGSIAGIRRADGTVVSVWPTGPSFARLINDDELVAGQVGGVSSGLAFAWRDGTTYPIGHTLAQSGYGTSLAIDLNQAGQLVGYATSSSGTDGYIWSPPVASPSFIGNFPGESLNTLPRAINNLGQVVGAAGSPQRAFIWTESTGMVDLLTRVVNPPSGLFLLDASAISDGGRIVVRANTGLFLLTPASTDTPVPPALGTIAANDPVAAGTPLDVSVAFTDFNLRDTHTATWTWGDGSNPEAGTVSEADGAGGVGGSHVFAAAGVYRVSVTVTDSGGESATVSRDVVVYDPNGGYVSGSGWFESPVGAFKADATLAGRAEFGFVSKYRKGATAPSGQTTFQFQAANLRFRSDRYEWLVVAGARAQYKGVGTLNGVNGYRFLLTAVDGALVARGTADRFRIKIWHIDALLNAEVVDYDNQIDAATEGGSAEGTVLGGGSIVIRK